MILVIQDVLRFAKSAKLHGEQKPKIAIKVIMSYNQLIKNKMYRAVVPKTIKHWQYYVMSRLFFGYLKVICKPYYTHGQKTHHLPGPVGNSLVSITNLSFFA